MSLLFDLAYALAALPAFPFLLLKSWRTGKYRTGLAGRFGFGPAILPRRSPATKVLLLHCVSVGELNSMQTLIAKLLSADPHLHIALTTGTDTGTDRACKLFPPHPNARVHPARFPFDFSFAVEHLFDRVRPDLIALVELETWPNFLSIARSRRIPVVLINGRLSERSFPRYQLVRPLMARMLNQLDWIAVQTPAIAARFTALGAAKSKLQVLPTLKYDNALIATAVPGQELLSAAMGLDASHFLFVAGSTGPGEEELLLDAYCSLTKQFPQLRMAIAPRHPEVVPRVLAAIKSRGLQPVLRTDRPDGSTPPPLQSGEVFVLNTLGELRKLYALGKGVFVGRSLLKAGGGGSDMIEVAALAKPCCFGPFAQNFAEVVELLLDQKTAILTHNSPEIAQTVADWLSHPPAASAMGLWAQQVIAAQRGSTDLYVQRLLDFLKSRESRPRAPFRVS